ncbi:hypothetical protein ACFQ4N_11105 [Oceanobacillus iheyensis]|uniref:Hypothetical conserved protein n=1 Tax=Oceanobacillus iheyensis (strain DSM 14371 / CIP 107618 / JCM 11309 / KCTC 3954 / HTE831) TaxID=221109 RepID=Q8EQY7_OCEIH|nr:hypothetical protein [Oceanobacillus iheyensis]BAC13503.1 hypothetical conserved protein [Oceanobacillus iheyensis HTE831]
MNTKQTYYVTIDTKEIRPFSVPDNAVEFEIEATNEQVLEIEEIFSRLDKESKNAINYIGLKPFDEWGVDDERDSYKKDINNLFSMIKKLGTTETQRKLSEMGISNP